MFSLGSGQVALISYDLPKRTMSCQMHIMNVVDTDICRTKGGGVKAGPEMRDPDPPPFGTGTRSLFDTALNIRSHITGSIAAAGSVVLPRHDASDPRSMRWSVPVEAPRVPTGRCAARSRQKPHRALGPPSPLPRPARPPKQPASLSGRRPAKPSPRSARPPRR